MTRVIAAFALVMVAAAAGASPTLLSTPPDQIDTILQLIDVVASAEEEVLSDRSLSDAEVDELRQLARRADDLGAEDLGARTRALLAIARGPAPGVGRLPAPGAPLTTRPPVLRQESPGFRTWSRVLAGGAASSIVLSGVFATITERDYQRWKAETDPAAGEELYDAWRGYEILSLSFGGLAVVAGGVGLPVLFSVSTPPRPVPVSPEVPLRSELERELRLAELYAERASVVASLDGIATANQRRTAIMTAGWIAGGVGTVAAITAFTLAEQRYRIYVNAPFSDEAEALRGQVRLLDVIGVASAATATVGFATAVTLRIVTPSRGALERNLRQINEEIVRVRAARVFD
ncbi:MAG: hypothetical protein EA382_10740 [Spirochaetaceae bacterium]|nr:MAG: hypothetical protein EA382_10740 [Spirochaetaceae bacterium]